MNILTVTDKFVIREIVGETIIVPLGNESGSTDYELYTLNKTGQSALRLVDGVRTVEQIANILVDEYSSPYEDIFRDVTLFFDELIQRNILSAKF